MIIATGNILRNLTAKGDNNDLIVLNDEQIKELQKKVLSMADDIVNICEENNLNYHLTGGSALGAVRHNGFIPWDDDFDIDIERKDFDKLLDLIKSKYGEKYYITCPKSKEGVQTLAAHVRLNNTVVRSCNDPTNEHCGVTIDIVIIENTFNNAILRKIHGIVSLALGGIVSCRTYAKYRKHYLNLAKGNEEATKAFKNKIFIGKLLSFLTLRRWVLICNGWNSICKNNNSEYVTVPAGRNHFFGETYKRKDFCEYTRCKFEGRNWKIPKEYDKYLKHMYKDYMQIPDEKHREHHVVLEFKLD